MTTIAYKDGILAGDGRITEGDHIYTDKCVKVFRLKDGSLFGGAGDSEGDALVLQAVREGVLLPELPADCTVTCVRVTLDGKVHVFEGKHWEEWCEPFIAIGNGKPYALTALRLGFSAKTAVKMGIAGDVHSGGKITSVKLKGIK